jgi:hypothetical protein
MKNYTYILVLLMTLSITLTRTMEHPIDVYEQPRLPLEAFYVPLSEGYITEHDQLNLLISSIESRKMVKETLEMLEKAIRFNMCPFEECNTLLTNDKDLKNHIVTHKKSYPCGLQNCNQTFMFKRDLLEHAEKEHAKGSRVHICPIPLCGEWFLHQFDLKTHKQRHA